MDQESKDKLRQKHRILRQLWQLTLYITGFAILLYINWGIAIGVFMIIYALNLQFYDAIKILLKK